MRRDRKCVGGHSRINTCSTRLWGPLSVGRVGCIGESDVSNIGGWKPKLMAAWGREWRVNLFLLVRSAPLFCLARPLGHAVSSTVAAHSRGLGRGNPWWGIQQWNSGPDGASCAPTLAILESESQPVWWMLICVVFVCFVCLLLVWSHMEIDQWCKGTMDL